MSDTHEIDLAEVMAPGSQQIALMEPRHLALSDPGAEIDWERIEREAALIATHPGLAQEFRDPTACRFVAYKAQRWGTDPVATAEKTYFTPRKGGGLNVGYEAQLVHAIVQGDPDLLAPLEITFGYSDPDKRMAQHRFCKVSGRIRGASAAGDLRQSDHRSDQDEEFSPLVERSRSATQLHERSRLGAPASAGPFARHLLARGNRGHGGSKATTISIRGRRHR